MALLLWAAVAAAHPLGEAPGEVLRVQGREMHLLCRGSGSPTVVFDAGLGGTALEWERTMRRAAGFSEACVYDRAGYGWSALRPQPRTSQREVEELRGLLAASGRAGPYLLVGHSYGGFNAQLFARQYPGLTAGLVLVDASHPEQVERFKAPPYNITTAPSARHGLVKFGVRPPSHPSLSRAARRVAAYQFDHWRPRRAQAYEMLGFRDSARQVRTAPALVPMPLVVITRGRRTWPDTPHGQRLETLWLTLQGELAAQSPSSAHLLARASSHMVHLEQPALVAYGIALAVDAWRASTTPGKGPLARAGFARPIADAVWLHDSLGLGAPGSGGLSGGAVTVQARAP